MATYIRTNGARVYLDEEALAHGEVRVEPGTLSDQCEGCGQEIGEGCHAARDEVWCDSCGTSYEICEETT